MSVFAADFPAVVEYKSHVHLYSCLPCLCSSIYCVHIVSECTLAGHKQLHWGLLCPPQCGWADTLSVTGHRDRPALLPYSQASDWPQKHWRGRNGTWKKKTSSMIDGLLWSYFLPPQNGWLLTTYSCLSNWGIIVPSVHTWQETYVLAVHSGQIYCPRYRKTKCLFLSLWRQI